MRDMVHAAGGLMLVAVPEGYRPIMVLILAIMGMVTAILILAHALGPKRRGPVKDSTYESGMAPIGDARRRFDVRFYLVAMLFLLFDVEVVLMWPWAVIFHDASIRPDQAGLPAGYDSTFLLVAMAIFLVLLLIGFVYEWAKGAFRWM